MHKTEYQNDGQADLLPSALLTMPGGREASWSQLTVYCIGFSIIGGLVITSFEPLVTSQYPAWLAALCWFAHLFVAACLLAGTTTLGVLLGARMPWALVAAVGALPVLLAPFSLGVEILLENGRIEEIAAVGLGRLYLSELTAVAPPSLGLAALVAIFAYRAAEIAERHREALKARHAPEPALRQVLATAPHHLGDDIMHAEAQGHYVNVTTTLGTATLKLGFSDCVTALRDFRGIQCHRSHWVRLKHVKKVRRAGSAYLCQLDDGTDVPVSRRRYRNLTKRL